MLYCPKFSVVLEIVPIDTFAPEMAEPKEFLTTPFIIPVLGPIGLSQPITAAMKKDMVRAVRKEFLFRTAEPDMIVVTARISGATVRAPQVLAEAIPRPSTSNFINS